MATYIALATFTEQGLRTVKDTVKRADAVRESAPKYGVKVRDVFWTQGPNDVVLLCEAPDDATASAFTLAVASAGNVRCQTLRAFTRDEMDAILRKVV
ncbi:MAG TPA: GYD domain-containing protein [Ramlibacter sp.]|uniref:GYD domain-containing protein n=1 Tax=Ramlibacter sp. TaxID=1917967 RepID=UPI002ED67923